RRDLVPKDADEALVIGTAKVALVRGFGRDFVPVRHARAGVRQAGDVRSGDRPRRLFSWARARRRQGVASRSPISAALLTRMDASPWVSRILPVTQIVRPLTSGTAVDGTKTVSAVGSGNGCPISRSVAPPPGAGRIPTTT